LNKELDNSEPVAPLVEAATVEPTPPEVILARAPFLNPLLKPAFWIVLLSLLAGLYVQSSVNPHWREVKTTYQTFSNSQGLRAYTYKGEEQIVPASVPYAKSDLRQQVLDDLKNPPALKQQWVVEHVQNDGVTEDRYSQLTAEFHFGIWSLLPALVAVGLCLLTKEPLSALFGGIVAGGFMLGKFDITDDILIPNLATQSAAGVLLLYLWLLGGLMGIWSRTGAAQAFAEYMSTHFVRGPRSAKLVAWMLGIIFFQGGSVSTVLVGTTVKPLADKHKISHEELSYIVDSTASPIAAVLAFNAWPAYVQALIFVPGVAFLSTEEDRLSFFFSSIPFSFYGILAVMGTLLLSLDIMGLSGSGMRKAHRRARETGELDAPGAKPLSAKELHTTHIPPGYQPNVLEFLIPLTLLIGIAVGTFIASGVPQVNWAFGTALMVSILVALFKGMSLGNVIEGFGDGLKGVVLASVILMLAITVGAVSKETGAGIYMVELLGQSIPFWILPVALQVLTMITAFSTGTSWGTYAIAFPLALPLAWVIAQEPSISNPELFMAVCFAAVLNGSIIGDQCSPISDTTILSSMTTGCDLMDHVKTQIFPATIAATLAGLMWTMTVLFFA
jgi:Na+/H+ antiporter NhaC